MIAGAMPNVTRSLSESSCAPIADIEFVSRATEPSIASRNIPMKISMPETVSVDQPHGPICSTGLIA